MLEVESGKPLKTWQLPGWPLDRFVYDAVALDAHRNEYLNYEGPVSRDRGTVRRVEGGNCTIRSLAGVSYTLTLATGVELWLFRDTGKGMDNKARRAWKASAV